YGNRSSFHLSYGERKLASIATVLSMDPQIIAFDEPTSNLDLAHRRKIINWLKQNNKTILLTTHDLDMAMETCKRVILLNSGKIVADGDVNHILRDKGLLEKNELELPISLQ
ncbi:MAG: energy-coupling factor ABC transporter ATP-binding protein, partial [Calditrichia bacterium]